MYKKLFNSENYLDEMQQLALLFTVANDDDNYNVHADKAITAWLTRKGVTVTSDAIHYARVDFDYYNMQYNRQAV